MLRRYTWEKVKGKLQHYRRRTPEASVLYQIVHHSRDDLQFQCEERFQHQYGCLRDEVVKTYDEYLNCGILAHGAARVYCDGFKHSVLIAFSGKRRGVCPSCGATRAVKFAEHLLGIDERELAAIFTVQTAGEALNQPLPGAASWQSQVQGWKYRTHTFTDSWQMATGKRVLSADSQQVDLKAIEETFAERVLAQLHIRSTLYPPTPRLRRDRSSELPCRLKNSQYKTTSSPTPPRTVRLMSLMLLSFSLNSPVTYRKPTNPSPGTMDGIPVGVEVIALSSSLPHLKNKKATIGESSVGVVGPRA